MRTKLWLSDPETGKKLQSIMKIVVGSCILWAAIMAYFIYDVSDSVALASSELGTKKKSLSELTAQIRQNQTEVGQSKVLLTNPPDGPATAQFSKELQSACAATGASLREIRYTVDAPKAAPPPAATDAKPGGEGGQAQTGATPTGGTGAAQNKEASNDGGWKAIGFESRVSGHFQEIMRFIEGLASMPRVIEVDSIQMARGAVLAVNRDVTVDLILKGHLYGLAGKK